MFRGRRLPNGITPLTPVRPNVGIAAAYRRRLDELITEMHEDVARRVLRVYRAHRPEFGEDDIPGPLTEAEKRRLKILATGGDDRLIGAQAPVQTLAQKGLIIKVWDPEDKTERWELTDAGERIARKLVTPADRLRTVVKNLSDKWLKRIDATAPKLADYFSKNVAQRSSKQLKDALSTGGFSVKMQMSPVMMDVFDATVGENVGLIKSIPQKYLSDVEGLVMRSVTRGRDLGGLAKELQKRYGLTKKRAALIAIDQNNKATSAMAHARAADLGVRIGIWRHSHAGKVPRPTHVAMDGKRYKITEGMYDKDPRVKRKVFPGELINCRCFFQPVIAGFS
jgi:SPP1 gp7 family putative phage head morphogenesis protein